MDRDGYPGCTRCKAFNAITDVSCERVFFLIRMSEGLRKVPDPAAFAGNATQVRDFDIVAFHLFETVISHGRMLHCRNTWRFLAKSFHPLS